MSQNYESFTFLDFFCALAISWMYYVSWSYLPPPLPWDFRNTFSFYIDATILIFYLSLTEFNQSFPPKHEQSQAAFSRQVFRLHLY